MRYVIDMNYCKTSSDLEQLLQDGHEAILPDDWLIEICKADTPVHRFTKNTSALRQYPDQIFVLKSRGDIFREDKTRSGQLSADDLIDFESTQTFRRWLSTLNELDELNHLFKKHSQPRINNQIDFVDAFLINPVEKLKRSFQSQPREKKQYNDRSTKIEHLK